MMITERVVQPPDFCEHKIFVYYLFIFYSCLWDTLNLSTCADKSIGKQNKIEDSVTCHLTKNICSFSCYESTRLYSETAARLIQKKEEENKFLCRKQPYPALPPPPPPPKKYRICFRDQTNFYLHDNCPPPPSKFFVLYLFTTTKTKVLFILVSLILSLHTARFRDCGMQDFF